jgi:probable O-glycosylation ligase (exosortase A-associated)
MRDILVTLIIAGTIPFILRRPYIGALTWVWLSVMNPHTQGWGFAVNFPFAAIIGGLTLISLVINKVPKTAPNVPVVIVFIAFVLWMNVTTVYALHPDLVYDQWNKVMKIMLMTYVTCILIRDKRHIQLLIGVIVFSLAYYGVKGGIFTLTSGGQHLVWGPGHSFIAGNNEIALALIITIPLLYYLQIITKHKLARYGLVVAMLLCAVAALGSYSRGALVALAAMGGFLWLKSQHKIRLAILVILAIPLVLTYMPAEWAQRMDTINTYEEDASVAGRFNAWGVAYNLANDRPFLGGGFEVTTREQFDRYAANVEDIPRAAHSIYFQALGEHGYVGLGLYLLLGFLTWRSGVWIIRNTKNLKEYQWASSLASMIQVSLIGFATGGAFLSLLYFDVPYYLMAAMMATRIVVEKALKEKAALDIPIKNTDSSRQIGKPAHLRPITRDSG